MSHQQGEGKAGFYDRQDKRLFRKLPQRQKKSRIHHRGAEAQWPKARLRADFAEKILKQ
jgi:hypothetical protein